MKWIKILECPYCGNILDEEYNYCCGEAGHAAEIEVCHNCMGTGVVADDALPYPCRYTISDFAADCVKCKGTGGRNEQH